MKKKETKIKYIETAYEISLKEGKKNVTLRRMATELGLNSATLYQYFEDMDELFLYVGFKYLNSYLKEVELFFREDHDSLEVMLGTWRIFAHCSFRNPKMYNSLFFNKHQRKMAYVVDDYYYLFPKELESIPEDVRNVFLNGNLVQRNRMIFQRCVDNGFLSKSDMDQISICFLQIYKGYLKDFLEERRHYDISEDVEGATAEMMHLFEYIIQGKVASQDSNTKSN